MNIHGKDIGDEQFKKLMKEHQEQQKLLANGFDSEREKQRKAMKQKVGLFMEKYNKMYVQVIQNRLGIVYIQLTHSFLLKGEPPPEYILHNM